MFKFGAIGVGNMTSAILGGMLKSEAVIAKEILLCDKHPEQHQAFYQGGATLAKTECDVVEQCEYVLLAVKPQAFSEVVAKLSGCKNHPVFISIMAGISAPYIQSQLGYYAKILLAMPNTSLLSGSGTDALYRVFPTSPTEF